MHYYLEQSGFEVCRIDGSVRLEERRKQVTAVTAFIFLKSHVTFFFPHCYNLTPLLQTLLL